ncbi:hypothetical protein ACF0H5_019851 [Mactra antiquata]
MLSVKERDLCIIFIVVIYCIAVCHASCPSFQVSHTVEGKSVCCKPVFDCSENHEVEYCSVDGGDDLCVPCSSGHVNWYNTSSLDPVKHSCFQLTENHSYACPIEDTHPTVDKEFCENMKCKCRFESCYYGDPCSACGRRKNECGVNEEINPETGDCEPCKDMMYSPVGCASCLYNKTAWLISQQKNQSVSEEVTFGVSTPSSSKGVIEVTSLEGTSKSDSESMDNDGADSNSGDIVVPVVIVLVILVVIGLFVACCLFTKRKVNNGDTTSFLARIYISVCQRNKKYKTDEETPKPASSSGDAGEQLTKPAASVAPFIKPQNAEGGSNGDAHMDLLKSSEGGACGADATDETADLSSDN